MHWGKGQVVEEACYEGEYHEPCLQLMEYENGSYSIRFAYFSGGRFQRSPLMIDTREIARMRRALRKTPRLRALLKKML